MSKQRGRSGYEKKIIATMPTGVRYESETLDYILPPATYHPDFIIYDDDDTPRIYIEAKGYLSPENRKKMLAVKKYHPHLDIRFLFQRPNNKISKRSKTKYWMWAKKHGFDWAGGDVIPTKWVEEVRHR